MKERKFGGMVHDIFENRVEMDSVHADTDKDDDEQPAPVILRQWV